MRLLKVLICMGLFLSSQEVFGTLPDAGTGEVGPGKHVPESPNGCPGGNCGPAGRVGNSEFNAGDGKTTSTVNSNTGSNTAATGSNTGIQNNANVKASHSKMVNSKSGK